MACYDVAYADAARAGGTQIIVMPIWGGYQTLAKARAVENQVYLVASGYDHPTYIINPSGEWLTARGASKLIQDWREVCR